MSATTETLTQKWLRQNIHLYSHKDIVYSHVDSVLARFPTLRPKTDVYTYDDGRTQLLLCIHGLLPISYRGTPYHIPIAVWITREYPRIPPIAYVVPTSDMLVRSGKYMDVSGKCRIEYLQSWERKSEACNLSALLEAMQDRFSQEPPVYAKAKPSALPSPPASTRYPHSAIPSYSERPPPPLPGSQTPSPHGQTTPTTTTRNDDRPPIPLKPGATSRSSMHSPTSSPEGRSGSPSILITADLATSPPPSLPPHPPTDIGLPQFGGSPIPPKYDPTQRPPSRESASSPNTPAWLPDPRMRPPPALPATISSVQTPLQSSPPSQYAPATHHIVPPAHPPPPPPPPPAAISPPFSGHYPTSFAQVPHPPVVLSPQSTGSAHIVYHAPAPLSQPGASYVSPVPAASHPPSIPPPDLLDDDDLATIAAPVPVTASFAPAPPRPPNPELLRLHSQVHAKFSSELASLSRAMALDAERLRANQADLLAGEPAIRDEMARLEAVRDVCRNVASRLRTVVDAAGRNVVELKRKGDPEVDELVCSTSIVHNQLINLVAEDNAIEDTMYHLHRALNVGRIDLERFLKTTRVLAEEQFMKRALIEKISTGIPMGPEWH